MKKSVLFPLLLLCGYSVAQVPLLDCKGAKKVRIELVNYALADTGKLVQVLYFDPKGSVIKSVKYDAANEPTEMWTHTYKYEKNGRIKSSSSRFKDYTKQLKPQKFKSAYQYNASGKLLKVENTQNQSGFECVYDSVGNMSGSSDYNSNGFFGGAKFTWKDGLIVKQKYEWSNKPPETTEFSYDASGRRTRALTYRGQKLIRKEEYTYMN